MKKYRCIYGMVFLMCLIALLLFDSLFLLWVCITLLMLPCVLRILLLRDRKYIQVDCAMRAGSLEDIPSDLLIAVHKQHHLWAMGMIRMRIVFYNVLFNRKEEKEILLPLDGKINEGILPYSSSLCGEVRIQFLETKCCDILGLSCVPFTNPREIRIVIYPKHASVQIIPERTPRSYVQGAYYQRNRKGNDWGEVYELRDYVQGDDIRLIHWKLSSRQDKLVLKQPSDPSHYEVVLLFDGGFYSEQEAIACTLLSEAVGLTATVSEQLVERHIPHYTGIPLEQKLHTHGVKVRNDWNAMLDEWMGLQLSPKSGRGLSYFLMDRQEENFTKIIYIAAGTYSQRLEALMEARDVTALLVVEEGEEIKMASKGQSQIIEIPVNLLDKDVYHITV